MYLIYFFLRERESASSGERGRGRGIERIPSRLHAQHEPDTGPDPTTPKS